MVGGEKGRQTEIEMERLYFQGGEHDAGEDVAGRHGARHEPGVCR